MSEKRLFEFRDDKSNKFWEIIQQDCDVTTRWGKTGTDGQSKTKTFDSCAAATKEYTKLIREKTSKGYVELTSPAPSPGTIKPESPAATTAAVTTTAAVSTAAVSTAALSPGESDLVEPNEGEEAADFDADELVEQLLAQLPEEMQASVRQDIQADIVGPHPEYITVHAAQPGSIVPNATTRRWIDQLEKDADHLGDFVILEFPVSLQAYRDTQNRLLLINHLGEHSWIDIYVRDQAEIGWTWTNVPTTDGLSPPWSNMVHLPDADLETLWKLAKESDTKSAERIHSANSFVETFVQSFRLSMMWRNSIGSCDLLRPRPPAALEQRVFKFAREYFRSGAFRNDQSVKSLKAGEALLNAAPEEAIEILISACRMRRCLIEMFRYDVLEKLCDSLLKKRLPYQARDLECLALFMERLAIEEEAGMLLPSYLSAVEQFREKTALPQSLKERLRSIRKLLCDSFRNNLATERARINSILGDDKVTLPMQYGEAWVDAVEADLTKMPERERTQWNLLFNHCVAATSAKWDAAWKKTAQAILKEIGADAFHQQLNQWLPALGLPRSTPPNRHGWPPPLSIVDENQDILRGLAWCAALCPTAESPRLLATLAISAFRKIPRVGSRAVRVGNACVMALTTIGTEECVGKLSLLKIKVKNGTALRYIDGQLQKTAERLNISREDLEEMSVPAYGMEEVGLRMEPMGDFVAHATVEGSKVHLAWVKSDGKAQKTVPSSVTAEHADELKELKADIKDIEKMLAAQRDRLENLYLRNRDWAFDDWRERYLDHPLVGIFARRLIWEFTSGPKRQLAIYHSGELRGVDDRPVVDASSCRVRLWHPLNDAPELIAQWRDWLVSHEVCQPFKQAHRETYVLTPAELTTDTYSNRFAAHILRQTQYRALAQSRLWQVNYLGAWDGGDEGVARKPLAPWNMRAEFWVTAAQEVDQFEEVTHVSTDQVRFYRATEDGPMSLREVPPLVFTEVMRDVDLFVGVASLGNDPNWFDQGNARGYQGYWRDYAFGELTAAGKVRSEVLASILPRLKVARQCRLEDRYLIVEGKLRTYKIHLGSSNILMEPNGQYLCIVPERNASSVAPTYLPYEGDSLLSIILSKALLLAQDDKIKDPSILAQIQRA